MTTQMRTPLDHEKCQITTPSDIVIWVVILVFNWRCHLNRYVPHYFYLLQTAVTQLKGHWHEKSVLNKHMGDILGLKYEPQNLF
jgi:hypothetical protein